MDYSVVLMTKHYFVHQNLSATESTIIDGVVVNNISRLSGKAGQMLLGIDFHAFVQSFHNWKAGELLQNAFPTLSADEREFVKTGITPQEWEDVFGE